MNSGFFEEAAAEPKVCRLTATFGNSSGTVRPDNHAMGCCTRAQRSGHEIRHLGQHISENISFYVTCRNGCLISLYFDERRTMPTIVVSTSSSFLKFAPLRPVARSRCGRNESAPRVERGCTARRDCDLVKLVIPVGAVDRTSTISLQINPYMG